MRSATPWWDQQHTNAFQVKGWGRQLPICMFSVTQAICPLCFSLLFHMSFVLLTHNCGLTSKPINLLDYRMSRHHTPCFSSSSIQLNITNRNFPTMEAWGSKSTSIHCQQWESENEASIWQNTNAQICINMWQIQIQIHGEYRLQIQIYGTHTYIFIVSVKVRMNPSSAVAKHKRSIWSQFGAVWRRLA